MWLWWLLGGLGLTLLCLVAMLGWQARRFRREVPHPPYRAPALHPRADAWRDDRVQVCWVGHSTLYIRWNGLGILTDPVFSERAGACLPGEVVIGVRRHTAPALRLEDVAGRVDVILLSHAHMDHFDIPSLRRLARPDVTVVTASGTGRLLRRMRFGRIIELSPPESTELEEGLVVTALPVRHWGARFPWNRGYGWNGYLLEKDGVRLLFAGDTAYTPAFRGLAAKGPVDIVCMPIGAYNPYVYNHCTPEQAWEMFEEAGGRWLIPMHWDTFVLSREPVEEPLQRLLAAAGARQDRVAIRRHGEVFTLPGPVPGSDREQAPSSVKA
ncbi:MAG: MBL fold metallo-hydrolase [Alicyclobacillus macrosporangiidus]|uniref:MBL fold metallo-hydrolase n=1 Tax=Alicyclobacillus macrosporangiidus TaxID=392015 RepID=UPI0026EEC580|nr:MBL fold metallo-hydrolase [Alicyclobacillus macrosporangiidus]MCL6598883.1 MBL fold metallo-hydrolase [Alicyclobacillus macrosporangiidus]